jgi:hypothetical protein
MRYTAAQIKIMSLLALIALPWLGIAQTPKPNDVWQPLRVFLGNWKGQGGGEPGKGEYERSYRLIFNEGFIEIKNKSSWQPTEQNPQGEVHEDLGYISYDKARNTFIHRQFHIEGFVNQYRLESISEGGKKIVFISEAIENIPAGWRAKETYQILGDHEFSETFELAPPDKEFGVYTKATLKRVK